MVSTSGCAKADEVDLVGHLFLAIGVGDEEDTIAKSVEWPRLKGSRVEYPTGINCKVLRKESFIDAVAREGTELKAVLKELEISRFKRVDSKDDKVRRSQAKRRMAAETSGSMEEKLSTPELNTPLKLARLNEMPDGPVDMVTVSSTVVVLEESDKIAEGADLRPHFEVEAGLLEEQCRAKVQEKMVAVMDDEFKKEREAFHLELEKERETAALKLTEVRVESVAEAERLVTASATSRNNLAGKLYQLRYTKAEIMAFSEGNYEEKEIMNEEEVEEMEVGLNIAEKTTVDNQETINQEKAASGSRNEAELAEYRIRALNEEISDMKCNIRALNEQLLKREINLDTVRTNLAVSEADFEKLSSSIVGKDRELRNSIQIRDSLIARDGEIASGEGSREMKEFLRRKEKLVENMRIDLTNSQQKSIDLTRQMSERIDQLAAELAESKARRLKDNKCVAVTHQAFKELVVEKDLMQDCFSGRTCVCKLDILSINPIGVMDRGIGTTMAELIARGREIVAERAPEYMTSMTEIGGSSSVVSPTPIVGGRSTALPSRKSSRVKKK
ncbi:hypothetical protein GIB67_008622 [Kingdonia uniflora]|uniref:Uncharacterized protein n=1 Tax=Kingdonia uniflora TaxID=39325 RepID=A0A7J7M4S6_9MAGN|nr:hypothetical protein GIB67_008622 [Kingdonia uniflora]